MLQGLTQRQHSDHVLPAGLRVSRVLPLLCVVAAAAGRQRSLIGVEVPPVFPQVVPARCTAGGDGLLVLWAVVRAWRVHLRQAGRSSSLCAGVCSWMQGTGPGFTGKQDLAS
jgi:hypothetical protein